ncbi:hypothetical protein METBIDRAFT_205630 [Metschnikowia bicuspidata var. bicuspidata NRRL YB-4993]|uniref:Uncharacterized protein n=1 Tax=Metschnikowia bicuspidata var. bicuspidata NRRL YB-4993 TaxID=869754 RepID=A0A1A0H9T7_9ASCO|nr:hypothetical protein METBIDRAFT_205630 [Metschnikowia bicuspidata var. bicuspidata NRRL YB-4993]OBA20760.1 hypothetical protein METBIDRAFT_205630 [Metschnikowia bicuspidata var. bicuspidata NRRL YB-4993]
MVGMPRYRAKLAFQWAWLWVGLVVGGILVSRHGGRRAYTQSRQGLGWRFSPTPSFP